MSEETTQDEPFVIDEAVLYQVLKLSNGDRCAARTALARSGIEITSEQLDEAINDSSILKAYFGSNSPVIHADGVNPEEALLRLPDNAGVSEADMARIVTVQDGYIAARGLEGVGFSSDDIEEMESMAQFVGHGFKKTVDITHGVMVTQLWQLKKRADEIRAILNNTETVERVEVTDSGRVVRYEGARFSDQEKLEWQKEYTSIIDQVRRISDSANQGAAIRLKAELASFNASEKVSKKPSRRLKKAN